MFAVTIKTDNEAFSPDMCPEVARILREVAKKVKDGMTEGRIRDINGNTVGNFLSD